MHSTQFVGWGQAPCPIMETRSPAHIYCLFLSSVSHFPTVFPGVIPNFPFTLKSVSQHLLPGESKLGTDGQRRKASCKSTPQGKGPTWIQQVSFVVFLFAMGGGTWVGRLRWKGQESFSAGPIEAGWEQKVFVADITWLEATDAHGVVGTGELW